MRILITFLFLLMVSHAFSQKKKNQFTIPKLEINDTPEINWISYPKDTANIVGSNIQTFSAVIKSRLPLSRVEIKINGITSDFYETADFAPAVKPNRYEQLIERTVTLRTGSNTIIIIATNTQNLKKEGSRRIVVDPTQISVLRSSKDQSAPMIYVSNPSNIKQDRVVVYDDMIKLTGTAIDESGIQVLKINGMITPVKENGGYVTWLPLNVGENAITVEAKDLNQNISLKKFIIERKNMDGSVYNFAAAKNYLIVIGINKYASWPTLYNATSDADSIKKVLLRDYSFEPENVTLLLDGQATRANIYQNLREHIEKVSPRDNLLIYYSGHGYFDKLLSEGYWVPVDGGSNDISSYVPNSQVLKIIENINSQHTFLVADACFSGSLFASTNRGYSEHAEKYKSRWGLASGRLEAVSDGSMEGKNSPFAKSFIEFLQNNRDAKVPVSDLIQYVKKRVAQMHEQTPIGNPLKGVGDEGGEFIFYRRTN